MIKHIVMFKFKEQAQGKTKAENVKIAQELILDLTDKIEVLKYMEVGINSKDASESNYDLVLISEFDTIEDLNKYAVHEEHMNVVDFIREVVETRSCVDYEK